MKKNNSFLTIVIVALIFCGAIALSSRAQETTLPPECHHCQEPQLLIEQAAFPCSELVEKTTELHSRKFSDFKLRVRDAGESDETVCEFIAYR